MADSEFTRFLKNEFVKCLKQAMEESVSDANWEFKEGKEVKNDAFPKIILLTISSHIFRLVFTLHFDFSQLNNDYVAKGLKSGNEKLGKDRINDYLCEVGNSFCGAFKRSLGNVIPSLGMSTPNLLDNYCLDYIDDLDVIDKHTALIIYNGEELFGASYFLCATENINVDMSRAYQAETQQTDAGELEFF